MNFELRKWRPEDAASIARHADNEKIARNLRDAFPHPYTLQDAQFFVERCAASDETRQLNRAIAVNGEAVGSIGLTLGSDVYRRSAELGYWLAEAFWGKGIMTEAVRRLCAEAFARFDIVRIFAEPYTYNTGSRRVLEKAGFTLEGIMRNGVTKRGKVLDYCMYALLRPEL
jgi:ribosomal-protein-alanine N-acetyltransferase